MAWKVIESSSWYEIFFGFTFGQKLVMNLVQCITFGLWPLVLVRTYSKSFLDRVKCLTFLNQFQMIQDIEQDISINSKQFFMYSDCMFYYFNHSNINITIFIMSQSVYLGHIPIRFFPCHEMKNIFWFQYKFLCTIFVPI